MSAVILRGDARRLPLADASVDLIVTSPPYFALRSYTDGGEHYDGQIGAEATPREYIDSLIACTREWVRVLKPSGSIWVNLGDKYAQATERSRNGAGNRQTTQPGGLTTGAYLGGTVQLPKRDNGVPLKSLMLLPERYRIACIDELGLIARAVVVWDKPNGLPESVTDRVRRSHEDWVHLTKLPRYFSAVDEIREQHDRATYGRTSTGRAFNAMRNGDRNDNSAHRDGHPLGKLPGSVWEIATEPLTVPDHLGVDHFAAFPTEWPRRIILGWSPSGICVECGEGRRPARDGEWYYQQPNEDMARRAIARAVALGVAAEEVATVYGLTAIGGKDGAQTKRDRDNMDDPLVQRMGSATYARQLRGRVKRRASGEACACPDTTAPTRPAVVLDPFSGTGTTALVADVLGRTGISVDMSADYCRLATWRTTDPGQRAKAMRVDKPPTQLAGQGDLFEIGATA